MFDKEKIETIFNSLQLLEIKATPKNVSILSGVYDLLRGMFKESGEIKNAESERGNTLEIS